MEIVAGSSVKVVTPTLTQNHKLESQQVQLPKMRWQSVVWRWLQLSQMDKTIPDPKSQAWEAAKVGVVAADGRSTRRVTPSLTETHKRYNHPQAKRCLVVAALFLKQYHNYWLKIISVRIRRWAFVTYRGWALISIVWRYSYGHIAC